MSGINQILETARNSSSIQKILVCIWHFQWPAYHFSIEKGHDQTRPSKVWKFQDFSITQILREINFGESRRAKTAIFAILGALNFVDLVHFSFEKVQKFTKKKKKSKSFGASKCVKMADFVHLES